MPIIARTSSAEATLGALPMLENLNAFYPGFACWFQHKVVPGVGRPENVVLLATEGEQLVGVALGKRDTLETKIRCVRVLPHLQNSGLGIKLLDRMIEELECEKPHCSVSEEMLHGYSRPFVNRYAFELSAVEKGLYRPRKLEYLFN